MNRYFKCPFQNINEEIRRARLPMTLMVYEQKFHDETSSLKYASYCWAISYQV